jgi:hypothetical protein
MKTTALILTACLLISVGVAAQTNNTHKSDSVGTSKIIPEIQQLQAPLKFEHPDLIRFPDFKKFKLDTNLVLNQRFRTFDRNRRPGRMPVMNPAFQSNMPVMKPDSTVHFFLRIKKIDSQSGR